MKNLVLSKPFGTAKKFYITKEFNDNDKYALQWYDKKLDISLSILPDIEQKDDIDGGSIPDPVHGILAPLQDKTAHGYGVHDKLWSHRVLLWELFCELGITFTQTNRIMQDIHRAAGCNRFEIWSTRLGVRWFGLLKWWHPNKAVRELQTQTLIIERGDTRDEKVN